MTEQNLLWVWFIDDIEYELVYFFFSTMHKKHHWKYSLTGINEFNHRYMNQKHLTIHIYLQISICYAIHYTNKIGMKYIPLEKGKKLTAKQYKKTYFESISIVIMPMILNSAQERHTFFGIINLINMKSISWMLNVVSLSSQNYIEGLKNSNKDAATKKKKKNNSRKNGTTRKSHAPAH